MDKRFDIQALRALAVFAVIFNHLYVTKSNFGYLGVDAFFVISGFVINNSLLKTDRRSLSQYLLSFYKRRVLRVVPVLYLLIFVSTIFVALLVPSPLEIYVTGIFALIGTSNIYLMYRSRDYFSEAAENNFFTHTWSLGVEEQYYLFFPLLLYFSTKTQATFQNKRNLLLPIFMFSASIIFYFFNIDSTTVNFYSSISRVWEFSLGVLASFIALSYKPLPQNLRRLLVTIGSVGLIYVLFFASISPYIATVLVAAIVAMLILLGCGIEDTNTSSSIRVVRYFGDLSYSLYIWHWFVICVFRWTYGVDGYEGLILVLTLLISICSYKYVERSFTDSIRNFPMKKLILYVSIACGVIMGLVYFCKSFSGVQPLKTSNIPLPVHHYPTKNNLPFNPTCVVDNLDRPYNNSTINECMFVSKDSSKPMIWGLGDSHLGHLQGLLHKLNSDYGIGFMLIETPGISFPVQSYSDPILSNRVFKDISNRMACGDILVVSRFYFDRTKFHLMPDVDEWIDNTIKLSDELKDKSINLVVVGPPPHFTFPDVSKCSTDFLGRSDCDVKRSTAAIGLDAINMKLKKLEDHGVPVFKQFDMLCPEGSFNCSPFIDGIYSFRDYYHLSAYGAAALSEKFHNFLSSNELLTGKSTCRVLTN